MKRCQNNFECGPDDECDTCPYFREITMFDKYQQDCEIAGYDVAEEDK
jgi:hypothetical protein